MVSFYLLNSSQLSLLMKLTAQTEAQGDILGDDFLSREKALLGDDANQFSTGNDHAAFVEDDDNDLLGGGGGMDEEVTEFESSFPAIDSRNEVCSHLLSQRYLSFGLNAD